MQIHNLKRNTKRKKARQVGRGGTRGKTSGRGTKGQNARAGRKKRPEMRDIIKKIPKLRGYAFKSIQDKVLAISISTLDKKFDSGAEVTLESLKSLGIISTYKGKTPKVKILARSKADELSKKLNVKGIPASNTAKSIIEKAGGSVA
jgi:large subunit ribosomal protein L15